MTQRVERADYVFEYKQYLDMGLQQWRAGWHYWYTFPLLSFDDALEEVGAETVFVLLWFENEDGKVYRRWYELAHFLSALGLLASCQAWVLTSTLQESGSI